MRTKKSKRALKAGIHRHTHTNTHTYTHSQPPTPTPTHTRTYTTVMQLYTSIDTHT
jgi:hypothetical protein